MNLFLFLGISIWGLTAFAVLTIIFYILEIAMNIVVGVLGGWSNFIWAIIKIIILIIFWKAGFPIQAILITSIVLYGIGSIGVVADPIGGGVNIALEILNLIGMFLFVHNGII